MALERINGKGNTCYKCGESSTSLCDATKKNGDPCNLPMCDECRIMVGVDLDVCEYHNHKKYILQAGRNRVEREEARRYFIQEYQKQNFRVVPGHWPDFATKKEVDDWIERQNEMHGLFDELFEDRED